MLLHVFYHSEKIDTRACLSGSSPLERRAGHRRVDCGWPEPGKRHEAGMSYIPSTESSGLWITGLHWVHQVHSFQTNCALTSAWCLCVCTPIFTVSLYIRMTFSPITTYPFRPSSRATLSVKPVWNTDSQKKSFPVLNARVAFLYLFCGTNLQTCWCFSNLKLSLTASASVSCFFKYIDPGNQANNSLTSAVCKSLLQGRAENSVMNKA